MPLLCQYSLKEAELHKWRMDGVSTRSKKCERVNKARIYNKVCCTWYCSGRRKRRKRFTHELFKLLEAFSLFQIVASRQCVIGMKYKQAWSLKGKTRGWSSPARLRESRKIRPENRFSKTLKWVYSSWAEGYLRWAYRHGAAEGVEGEGRRQSSWP